MRTRVPGRIRRITAAAIPGHFAVATSPPAGGLRIGAARHPAVPHGPRRRGSGANEQIFDLRMSGPVLGVTIDF